MTSSIKQLEFIGLLTDVVENVPIRIFWKDRAGHYLGCNTLFARDAGLSHPAELIGKTDYDMGWKDQAELYRADDASVMESGIPRLDYEEPQTTPDGKDIWLRTSKVPLRNAQNEVVGILGVYDDITVHKRTAATISRMNNLYNAMIQCSHAITHSSSGGELFPKVCRDAVEFGGMRMAWIGLVDEASRRVRPVAAFGAGIDYLEGVEISVAAEDPAGRGPTGTAIRENRPYWCQDFLNDPLLAPWHERGTRSGWRGFAALPLLRAGKVIGAFSLYAGEANAFDKDERNLLLGMAGNISHALDTYDLEAKRIEQQYLLEASKKRFQMLFDISSDGMFILDMQGAFIDVNKTAHERLGYTKEEMLAMHVSELDSPEFAVQVPERLKEIFAQGMAVFETAHCRKDGSIMPVEVNSKIIEIDGRQAFFSVVRDISERKKLEEQLRQSQKMEAIGTLVGGIAHDFNNMLAAVQGNVYLAKKQMQNHAALDEKLTNIEELGNRAAGMVKQLLAFARQSAVSMQVLSLNSFMNEGYKLSRALIPENIDHRNNICPEELYIRGDVTQLQQTLFNLLSNAIDAVAGVAAPKIRCNLVGYTASSGFRRRHPEISAKRLACLSLEDNGHGIPQEKLDKIFEPFFTTKEVGRGTGLGLSMLYGTVQTHGGVVEVDSELGRGSTFRVYLPLCEGDLSTSGEQASERTLGQGETILIVDDQDDLRTTSADVLGMLGYHVLQAGTGREALDIFQVQHDRIDLILSDVVMPEMGGQELLQAVRQVDEHLPVILATGYDRQHVLDQNICTDGCHIISKPFDFEALSQTIRELIHPE